MTARPVTSDPLTFEPVAGDPSSDSANSLRERGRSAVLARQEVHEMPPHPGGARWPLSVIVRPDPGGEERLAALTEQALGYAGAHQWSTGAAGSSHLTVCFAESEHRLIATGDARASTAAALLRPILDAAGPLAWTLSGVALARSGVLALATPVGSGANALRTAVLKGFGCDGEQSYRGDVWWSALVHFAGPVEDPVGLVRWCDSLADRELGQVRASRIDLVRYDYRAGTAPRTVPFPLASFPLPGPRSSAAS